MDNFRFAESDTFLCFHGPMLYEAICLNRRITNDGKAQYYIHYKGWKNKWDEWVDENRVLELLKETYSKPKNSGAKHSSYVNKEETTRNVTSPKKGKNSETTFQSTLIDNVISAAEPKSKKRGRPSMKGRKHEHLEISSQSTPIDNVISSAEPKSKNRGSRPSMKGRKHEHLEISSQSTPIDNIISAAEPKSKKRGRPSMKDRKHEHLEISSQSTPIDNVISSAEPKSKNRGSRPSMKGRKHEHLEISSQSTPIDNIISAAEPKSKKRGRPSMNGRKHEHLEISSQSTPIDNIISAAEPKSKKRGRPSMKDRKHEHLEISSQSTPIDNVISSAEPKSKNRGSRPSMKGRKHEHLEISSQSTPIDNIISAAEPKSKKRGRPSMKDRKHEHLEISSQSTPIDNVISSAEPKSKNRVRSLKNPINKIVVMDMPDAIAITDAVKGSKVIRSLGANKTVGSNKSAEVSKAIEANKKTGINKTVKVTKTDEQTKEIKETVGETTDNTVIISAPVNRVEIDIPSVLKARMVYDYKMTVLNNKILKFPKLYTVEKLIRAYICSKSKPGEVIDEKKFIIKQRTFNIGLNLIQYFNTYIHKTLLYNKEKEYGLFEKAEAHIIRKLKSNSIKMDFEELMYPKVLWHYIYSPTYLLRLFKKIPEILTDNRHQYNNEQLALIIHMMDDFLKFVESQYDTYFSKEDYMEIQ